MQSMVLFVMGLIVTCSCALAQSVESEVTFKGVGGLVINGTLSMPAKSARPAPAVLLLSGSGPTDRNGNQPPALVTDLLKQVADRLSQEGIASLRFDKRATRGYAASWPKDVTAQNDFFAWDMFVGDAKAALLFLRAQHNIDARHIFIAGHSEGSMIAGQIGHDLNGKPAAPAGLILMGAPGRTLDIVIREQVAANLAGSGLSVEARKPYMDYVDLAINRLKADGSIPPNPPQGLGPLFPPSAAKLMRSYFTNDPAVTAAGYGGPVLIVQGEKDIQVSAKSDTPLLAAALKARQKGATEIFVAPGASHNLKVVADEKKEPRFAGPVVPSALDTIVAWLKANAE